MPRGAARGRARRSAAAARPDGAGQRLAVRGWEERIVGAVDHERRHADLGQPGSWQLAALEQEVVGRAGGAARAVVRAAEQHAHGVLVDAARPRVGPLALEQVGDRRVAVGPVGLLGLGGEELPHGVGHRRQLLAARALRAGAHQADAEHTLGVPHRDVLRDPAAHREAGEVRALHAEVVEDPERVGHEVVAGVARLARRVGRRTARVAVVVADDEAPGGGEALAERLLPAVHRGRPAHDQQHGRFARVAEGVDAQLGVVDLCSHEMSTSAGSGTHRSTTQRRFRPVS